MIKFWKLWFGRVSETKAKKYLQKAGYAIIQRNWRSKIGELDIVAQKDGCIVFVEVKALVYSEHFSPEDHYDWKKRRKQIMLGKLYLAGLRKNVNAQFDLITVVKKGRDYFIEHHENVIDESS